MRSVYRAVQLNIGKTVAVKVLLPQLSVDEQIVRRFEHEARAASLIHHPHAINVFDFGYADGGPFIAMDFIRGESLDAVLRREGALSLSRAGELLGQVCSALQAAHEQGVVHRDVKPSNISEDEAWEKELETEREKDEREYEKHLQEKGRERDKERRGKWNPFRKLKKLFD